MFVPLEIDSPVWVWNLTCGRGWVWQRDGGMESSSRSVDISTEWRPPCVTLRPWMRSPLRSEGSIFNEARMTRREVLRLLALSLLRPPAFPRLRLPNPQWHDGLRQLADHAGLR